jgi:hypothetical protein
LLITDEIFNITLIYNFQNSRNYRIFYKSICFGFPIYGIFSVHIECVKFNGIYEYDSCLVTNFSFLLSSKFVLSCTCSIWGKKLHWLDNIVLHVYTVTDRNRAFSGNPSICYPLRFRNLIVNPVHFLLTENIKRDNQGIIILFYYLIQNRKVDGLWFFCKISAILMQGLKM